MQSPGAHSRVCSSGYRWSCTPTTKSLCSAKPKKDIVPVILRHSEFIDLICSVRNHARTLKLEYNLPSIQERVSNIGRDISASDLRCGASDSICMHYASIAKILIKNPNICNLGPAQCDSDSDEAVLGVTHLDDRTRNVTDGVDLLLLVQTAKYTLNNSNLSSAFFAQPVYLSERRLLRLLHQLCNPVHETRLSNSEEPLSFRDSLDNEMEQTKTSTNSVEQTFLNTVRLFVRNLTTEGAWQKISCCAKQAEHEAYGNAFLSRSCRNQICSRYSSATTL